ncbi:ComF family protein [Facklamia sp. 7083-14-GEN3]|uniref:ComF family protein n=1 Tax=Facklamia sp. 7083-14-GEN3 TaxID=2973478 RepID=UPI00215CDC58|nr:ComF family protein [Facklamia sp. 7083-14-GEN3]MCR8969991.1 ComF family protein [Facklamia sp. 7083-14-GEN3]
MQKFNQGVCLMCQKNYERDLTWQQLFSWEVIEFEPLCGDCFKKFVPYRFQGERCRACGRKLDGSTQYQSSHRLKDTDEYYCLDCYRWRKIYPLKLINNQAVFDYNDSFKEWITRYKYDGDCRMASVMKQALKKAYKQYANYIWLVLTSSESSLKERLFHPTAYLLEIADIPYCCPFRYIGNEMRQAAKSRKDRLALTRPYAWINIEEERLKGKKGFLIFDDVYTTGATMIQAKLEITQNFEAISKGKIDLKSITLARNQLIG